MLTTHRIATWAFGLWRGDRATMEQLVRLGESVHILEGEHPQLTMTGPSGVRGAVALGMSDPFSHAVMLAYWFLGERWPDLAPDLLETVNKRWGIESNGG